MSHVEQRHRLAARKWLDGWYVSYGDSLPNGDALARLLADTERAALDRAAQACEGKMHRGHSDGFNRGLKWAAARFRALADPTLCDGPHDFCGGGWCINCGALAASPTTED